jgi:TPR repeat protein
MSTCVAEADAAIETADFERARELSAAACDLGNAEGCAVLGALYANGLGVPTNDVRAFALWTRACEGDAARGCANLGWMYWFGRGTEADPDMARALWELTCGLSARACAELAEATFDTGYPAQAAIYARHACGEGDAMGCRLLGTMHERGSGAEPDRWLALALYERACEGDDAFACTLLGTALWACDDGPCDRNRATDLFVRACIRGQAQGCTSAGMAYLANEDRKADLHRELLERGCELGDPEGCTWARELADTPGP